MLAKNNGDNSIARKLDINKERINIKKERTTKDHLHLFAFNELPQLSGEGSSQHLLFVMGSPRSHEHETNRERGVRRAVILKRDTCPLYFTSRVLIQ